MTAADASAQGRSNRRRGAADWYATLTLADLLTLIEEHTT